MRILRNIRFYVVALAIVIQYVQCTAPTGCTYDSSDSVGIYTCDFTAITLPLTYSGFSPAPQRLVINKIDGSLGSGSTFSGFSSFSSASLDKNYIASLDLQCSTSATVSLTIAAGTFTDMSYVQKLTITNCRISNLPADVFLDFGQLDTLIITGGQIDAMDAGAFNNIDIGKLDLIPQAAGLLELSNLVMPSTTLTTGIFTSLVNVSHIKLDNIGLTAVVAADFSSNTGLHTLTVSNNAITTIPTGFFTGLDGIAIVDFSGTSWDCSCTNLWFLTFADTNGIEIQGGANCGSPSSHARIALGTSCMPIWDLIGYIILVIALVISCVALGLICHTRRQLLTAKNKLATKKNTSWNKVQEAMKRRGGAGQKPPAASTQPNKGKGWV
ncbi:hypothetical protein KUTeg_001710 [Tegillarca granosa]|uniref:Uncharacterized protein n=1 Tax=Tegillarca granosa TaxID=220873 RepID=A0ABQ9FS91_TEGGR|nr:hypothetical protein KUTeg_001710 [Tegillarca granosa]